MDDPVLPPAQVGNCPIDHQVNREKADSLRSQMTSPPDVAPRRQHVVTAGVESPGDCPAEEAGGTGHKDAHRPSPLFVRTANQICEYSVGRRNIAVVADTVFANAGSALSFFQPGEFRKSSQTFSRAAMSWWTVM